MIRNSGLRNGKRKFTDIEVNPMDSVTNLVDIMMVFACGLMIALILRWNVSIGNVTSVIDKSELVEVDNPNFVSQDGEVYGEYESKGIVVEDPETGKIYVIKK